MRSLGCGKVYPSPTATKTAFAIFAICDVDTLSNATNAYGTL